MKLYTFGELYQEVKEQMIKNDLWTDILDYDLVGSQLANEQIDTDEFEITYSVRFGGSEGAYLDLYVEWYEEKNSGRRECLATIKTLSETDAGFRKLAMLGADFYLTGNRWVRENGRILYRTGYRIEYVDRKTGEIRPGACLVSDYGEACKVYKKYASIHTQEYACRFIDCETLEEIVGGKV